MAIITIPVTFNADRGLTFPEETIASKGDTIRWLLTDENVNRSSINFKEGLEFAIYFDKKTPFDWAVNSTTMTYPPTAVSNDGLQYQMTPQVQVLAQAVAKEKGDYKYGLRVLDLSEQRELYDDDPRLIII
jgi:hypothetical protein